MPEYRGADDAELFFEDRGDGPPIVVLGGGAPGHPDYLEDLAGLGDHYRLIVPHLRGVGRSPSTDGDLGAWWHESADIDCLRKQLGLDRLTIVAHSSGTRLAISYAVQHPERVARILLITPPSAYLVDEPSDVPEIAARRSDAAFVEAYRRMHAESPSDQASLEAWTEATAPVGYAAWGERQQLHSRVGSANYRVNRTCFSVAPPADLADRLAVVEAPVLVIAGAEDALTGAAPAVALARLFPRGTATVLDGSGHYPWVDQPWGFLAAARRFLDEPG
ncbi:alpha/beta fold hydrolase [Lacisediminihabitans sp.]|uniref:alpha/beta fold hydrolase n=1 Tax=Lacisediminihabitans sp. TaxID=2787631 RepID=UPI00374D59CF